MNNTITLIEKLNRHYWLVRVSVLRGRPCTSSTAAWPEPAAYLASHMHRLNSPIVDRVLSSSASILLSCSILAMMRSISVELLAVPGCAGAGETGRGWYASWLPGGPARVSGRELGCCWVMRYEPRPPETHPKPLQVKSEIEGGLL